MKTLKKRIATLALAGLCLALDAQANGGESENALSGVSPSRTVHSSDLDLGNAKDAQILYRRLQRAARSVCRQAYSDSWDVKRESRQQRCYARTLETVVEQLHIPALTAIHRGEIGRLAKLR